MFKKQSGRQAKKSLNDKLDERIYISLNKILRLRYQATGFSFLPRQPVHSLLTGQKHSRLRGRGLDFIEMRHYRPGDDIRALDWRVTNRTGKPHVRIYAEEKDRRVFILVDQRISMFFGSQHKMKSVVAAEVAALAAWRTLSVGDRVGLILFNNEKIKEFKPSRSESQLLQGYSHLIAMNHALNIRREPQSDENSLSIKTVLQKVENVAGHDSLIVVISDFLDWDSSALKSCKRLSQHNDVIAGLVYDPLERNLFSADKLVISDGQYQFEIDSKNKKLLNSYNAAKQQKDHRILTELRRHQIPVIPFDTITSAIKQIQSALGRKV